MSQPLFPADDLAAGSTRMVEVDGISIVVVREVTGRYYALRNLCPHQGGRLSDGQLEAMIDGDDVGDYVVKPDRQVLRCPLHGYEFDLDTGRSLGDPKNTRVRAYPVAVEDGILTIELRAGKSRRHA